jgi:hypothetical protein
MGMEHWWNYPDRGKLKYWEKNLSQCHFVHHINPASTGLGFKLGLQSKRPAINLSCMREKCVQGFDYET